MLQRALLLLLTSVLAIAVEQCHVDINLPEVSFFETLMVKVNETHEDLYIHDVPSFDSVRPVFTQERGPFIFTTLLPGMPKIVRFHGNVFHLKASDGTCMIVTIHGPIRCKVVQGLDDFRGKNNAWQSASSVIELKWLLNYRGLPEQQHLECLLNGKPLCSGVTITSQWGKCPVEQCHVDINLPEVSFFETLMVKVNETHEDLYIHDVPSFDSVRPVFTQERGPFIFTTLLPGMPKILCFSVSQDICGYPHSCVSETENNRTVMRYKAKQGKERMSFYTCEYRKHYQYEIVSYRHHWSGLDDFRGKNNAWQSALAVIELKWLLNYRGPPEQQV
nr:unnamed protein product [Spirometra erinaceieuropaei]